MEKVTEQNINKATKLITIVLGITIAISGLHHGFFEILQGNKPTNGLIIQSIGIEYQRWNNGDEALTIIPNFFITGVLAFCVSLLIIFWTVFFIHKRYGRIGFLLLYILLTLVGGGIGHILFFLTIWLYATRMHKPLCCSLLSIQIF